MALDTVADYLAAARVLLQDMDSVAYRYLDAELVNALNMGILEGRRLRPDLFFNYLGATLPSYSTGSTGTTVVIDPQYRVAFVYYICGQAQLRDEENTQDARSAVFLNKFVAQLQNLQA